MDNIEKLVSGVDPAERDNIGDPGPLQLQDPVPVFSQLPVPAAPRKPRGPWRVLAAGTAIAAAAVGLVVWSPWQAPTNTGPAAPSLPLPGDPTTGPSPSSSVDGSTLPRIDYGLPNFLVPAHQDVYVEDSDACNALDLRTLDVVSATGVRTALPDNAQAYPVIGCVQGLAMILRSDLAELTRPTGEGTGAWLARWKDGGWIIQEDDASEINDPVGLPFFIHPHQRSIDTPNSRALGAEQERQLDALGLGDAALSRLLGPDVPSWMGTKATEESHAYGNELLTVDHPAWEPREWLTDGDGAPVKDPAVGPNDAVRYDLRFYDQRGKQVFNLTSVKKGSVHEPTDCDWSGPTYRLEGVSPSGVVTDAGPLNLALRTDTLQDGTSHSMVGLFPASLPTTGRACDVRLGVHAGDRTLMSTQWNGPMVFKDQAEIDAYLGSIEYAEAKAVAASLALQDPR